MTIVHISTYLPYQIRLLMQAIPYSFMSLWLKLNASVAHDNYDNLLTYKLWFWMVACLDVCPSVHPFGCLHVPGQKRQMTIVAAPTQRNSTIVSAVSYPPSSPHHPWAFSKKRSFIFFGGKWKIYIFQVGPQFQSFRSLANFPSKWWFCWLCVCVCPCYFCVDMFAFWQVIYGKQQYTISGRDHSNVLLTSRREETFVCLPPWMTCHCGSLTATAVAIC